MWYTVLDNRSAFWVISIHPEGRPKTAFIDGNRLFHLNLDNFAFAENQMKLLGFVIRKDDVCPNTEKVAAGTATLGSAGCVSVPVHLWFL